MRIHAATSRAAGFLLGLIMGDGVLWCTGAFSQGDAQSGDALEVAQSVTRNLRATFSL
jgi:hypothetical protein